LPQLQIPFAVIATNLEIGDEVVFKDAGDMFAICSSLMLLQTASKHQHIQADAVIIPPIAHLRPDEIGKMEESAQTRRTSRIRAD
jgi:hypothetical protein